MGSCHAPAEFEQFFCFHWKPNLLQPSYPTSTAELSHLYSRAIPPLQPSYPTSTAELSHLHSRAIPPLQPSYPTSTSELSHQSKREGVKHREDKTGNDRETRACHLVHYQQLPIRITLSSSKDAK